MTHSDPVARTALSPSVGPDIWAVLEANLPREEFAYLRQAWGGGPGREDQEGWFIAANLGNPGLESEVNVALIRALKVIRSNPAALEQLHLLSEDGISANAVDRTREQPAPVECVFHGFQALPAHPPGNWNWMHPGGPWFCRWCPCPIVTSQVRKKGRPRVYCVEEGMDKSSCRNAARAWKRGHPGEAMTPAQIFTARRLLLAKTPMGRVVQAIKVDETIILEHVNLQREMA